MRNKLLVLVLIFSFLLTSGFGCKIADQATKEAMKPVELNYWRVWDGPDAFEEIIANYKALHPYVTINYRKLRYSEYEKELLEALAEDKGPDILSLHNTWMKKYQTKLAPLPAELSMVYQTSKGTIKKEVVSEIRKTKSLSLKDLKNNFVDAVYGDVVLKDGEKNAEKIFGLPLALDSLALYYNKDLLNNASIAEPPVFWNREFQQMVKKLTKQDEKGQIIQAGVAMGGSTNIERYSDILSVLMMQNGAVMADQNGNVTFDKIPSALQGQNYSPGLEALRFYTDFSNPAKEVYSWTSNLNNSLSMFISGKLAMMFGYAYHMPTIKSQAPKLNFSVAKLPQIEGNISNVNFTNYWVEAVSNKSQHINEAWDFVQFATKAEQAKSYLEKTEKPAALRALVDQQIESSEISAFAEQVLTAKSWYHGEDPNAAEAVISDMIDSINKGESDIEEAISLGAKRVQQTMDK